MAGRLLTPLEFVSDADLAVDFLIQSAGQAVDLTGYGVSLVFAKSRGTGGFELTVGSGILTPGPDGRVSARLPGLQVAGYAGDYSPCELRLTAPDGAETAWLIFSARISTGASQIMGGMSRATAASGGVGAQTITVNWTPSTIIVDAAVPGAAGLSMRETLIATGELSAGSTNQDAVNWLIDQVGLSVMSTTFFASEGGALPNGQTFHSGWRDVGVAPGVKTAVRRFNALIRADQPGQAWIETSPDQAAAATQASSVLASGDTLPLSVPITARYCRVAVLNNSGADMAALHVETSFT